MPMIGVPTNDHRTKINVMPMDMSPAVQPDLIILAMFTGTTSSGSTTSRFVVVGLYGFVDMCSGPGMAP